MAKGKRSPLKLPILPLAIMAAGAIGGGISAYGGAGGRRRAVNNARAGLDSRLSQFEKLDDSNLYSNIQNPYANLQNTYEDLTVNQKQAQFQQQQFAQSQANVMQGLQGAAGASGIAGLAQSMVNQAALQGQRMSASIGMQEARNQQLAAQGAARVQQLDASGQMQQQQLIARGATQARNLQYQKSQALVAAATGRLDAANQAVEAAKQRQGQFWNNIFSVGGSVMGMGK